jgi:hypothetical protein
MIYWDVPGHCRSRQICRCLHKPILYSLAWEAYQQIGIWDSGFFIEINIMVGLLRNIEREPFITVNSTCLEKC